MTLVYSFELIKHANIRYRQTVPVLAHCELFAMLSSLGISCDIQHPVLQTMYGEGPGWEFAIA